MVKHISVTEAMVEFSISRGTVYRRIKTGKLNAHKEGRSWRIELAETGASGSVSSNTWNPQIHRSSAEEVGLTPADFTWLDYPISNVRLAHPFHGSSSRWALFYLAEMPSNTPHLNQYEQVGDDWIAIPDPTGSALAWVKFKLIDTSDGVDIHDDNRDHVNGEIQGGITEAKNDLIWKRLLPGTTLTVRLEAVPYFFPYSNPEAGEGGNFLTTNVHGYLVGNTETSKDYQLSMTQDGELLIDGEAAPPPPEPEREQGYPPEMDGMFGYVIRILREKTGKSRVEIARQVRPNIDEPRDDHAYNLWLELIESDSAMPTMDEIPRLADALGVNRDHLMAKKLEAGW